MAATPTAKGVRYFEMRQSGGNNVASHASGARAPTVCRDLTAENLIFQRMNAGSHCASNHDVRLLPDERRVIPTTLRGDTPRTSLFLRTFA